MQFNLIVHIVSSESSFKFAGGKVAKMLLFLRQWKWTILAIVYLSYFLDNVLMTVVVPIIPNVIYEDYEKTKALNKSEGYNFNEDVHIGFLFGSKALVQLFINPILGSLTRKYGYTIFLVIGNGIFAASSVLYGLSSSYGVMLLARIIHGVGSTCATISGLALLADTYTDDATRSKAMGIAFGGMALGVVVGYPFGGFLYDFISIETPYFTLAIIILICISVEIVILWDSLQIQKLNDGGENTNTPSVGFKNYRILFSDRDILIISGAVGLSTAGIATLEPCLPIWLRSTIKPEEWQLGTAFIPDSIGYLIGTNLFGFVATKFGKWRTAAASNISVGISLLILPFATRMTHLIVPHFGLGLGVGAIDASMMPLLATIVDQRYPGLYGACYAVSQTTVCLAYFLGPLLGASLIVAIGFPALIRLIGIANIIQVPFDVKLRYAEIDDSENIPLVNKSPDFPDTRESSVDFTNFNGAGNFYSYGTTNYGDSQNFF